MDERLRERGAHSMVRRSPHSGVPSPLVGRVEEMHRLSEALARAGEGEGCTIFLTGQPGIGKTRLALEALALARGRGFTTLQGRAAPVGMGLAYAPFLETVAPFLNSLDSAHLADLVTGLADLGRLFGSLGLPPPEPLGDLALEKARLLEAVSRLIARLSKETPVVMFIDDVHRADRATIELLHYLSRGLADQRALLIATYCASDMEAFPDLRAVVTWLQRVGLAEEISIPRLSPDSVEKLVRAILGGDVPSELLALLEARAGGAPFYIEALIADLIDSGVLACNNDRWDLGDRAWSALPQSVRRLILERLDRLVPEDRHVLDLLAVMADATPHSILGAACGLGEEILIGALRRLRAAGLVAEGMGGSDVGYSITHPLIQEVAYAELPEVARRRAHVAAISAFESLSDGLPSDLNHLARHYREAGHQADPSRALALLLTAGDRARSLYANDEAARHYAAALAMLRRRQGTGAREQPSEDHTPDPQTAPGGHSPDLLPWLLERLGDVWEGMGQGGDAIRVWNEALAERERGGCSDETTRAAARLRCHLAIAEWDRGHFDIANAHLSAGFGLLCDYEPCQELADLHFARFRLQTRLGDVAGMTDAAEALLSEAKRLASPRAEAEANVAVAISCLWQNDLSNAREHARQALRASEEAQQLAMYCYSSELLIVIGMRLGDHKFMRDHAKRGLLAARRLGAPAMEVQLRLRLACANFMAGDWSESLRNSMEAIVLARRVGHPRHLAFSLAERAMVLVHRGDLVEAEDCIAEARTAFGRGQTIDRYVFGLVDIAETALALQLRQVTRALRIAIDFARRVESWEIAPTGLTAAFKPMGLVLLAEAQAAAGDAEAALETGRLLSGLGPSDAPYLIALGSRAEGLARQAQGQWEAAGICHARAYAAFTALDMPFEAARSLLEQAEATITEQPKTAALVGRDVQQSLAMFVGLGAQHFAYRAQRLLQILGNSPPAPRRRHLSGGPMSSREIQIARLVAEGLTTPQIARRLILSPHTVSNTLDRIYTRLDIGSRTALARYVIENGLL